LIIAANLIALRLEKKNGAGLLRLRFIQEPLP
jgi:hypothetical protein